MRTLRIDFDQEMSVELVTTALLNDLPMAHRLPGDPFDRNVSRHINVAEKIQGTPRGKQSFVESARRLKQRIGPGIEIRCTIDGVVATLIVSRQFVVATFAEAPSQSAVDVLKLVFRSLGDGVISDFT